MVRFEKLNKRLNTLEAQASPCHGPPWCDWRRKLAHCNAFLAELSWTCPEPMNPEKKAWRDAKRARYQDYFDKLGVDREQGDGNESR